MARSTAAPLAAIGRSVALDPRAAKVGVERERLRSWRGVIAANEGRDRSAVRVRAAPAAARHRGGKLRRGQGVEAAPGERQLRRRARDGSSRKPRRQRADAGIARAGQRQLARAHHEQVHRPRRRDKWPRRRGGAAVGCGAGRGGDGPGRGAGRRVEQEASASASKPRPRNASRRSSASSVPPFLIACQPFSARASIRASPRGRRLPRRPGRGRAPLP